MADFEDEYVRTVYDVIADHWDRTRFRPWPFCESFLDAIPPHSVILEVGCGNGRNMIRNHDCVFLGCDNSLELVKVAAQKRKTEVCHSDALRLPYRSECMDVVLSIAVLHHMSTVSRRTRMLEEMFRVLRRGGQMLVYARSFERQKLVVKGTVLHQGSPQDVLIPWNFSQQFRFVKPKNPVVDANGLDQGLKPQEKTDNDGDQPYLRYHHLFQENELRELLTSVKGARLVQWTEEVDNWIAVLTKE